MINDPLVQRIGNSYSTLSKTMGSIPRTKTSTPSIAQSAPSNETPTGGISDLIKSLGAKTTDWGGTTKYEKFHPGIDIANKIGTPIRAFANGIVSNVVLGKKQGDQGYGNQAVINDNAGNQQKYSHLLNSQLKPGQRIKAGDVIGYMGNSGSTYSNSGGTGSHLDYRIWNTYQKKYVNPYTYLNSNRG